MDIREYIDTKTACSTEKRAALSFLDARRSLYQNWRGCEVGNWMAWVLDSLHLCFNVRLGKAFKQAYAHRLTGNYDAIYAREIRKRIPWREVRDALRKAGVDV